VTCDSLGKTEQLTVTVTTTTECPRRMYSECLWRYRLNITLNFSSVLPGKLQDITFKYAMTVSFQIPGDVTRDSLPP